MIVESSKWRFFYNIQYWKPYVNTLKTRGLKMKANMLNLNIFNKSDQAFVEFKLENLSGAMNTDFFSLHEMETIKVSTMEEFQIVQNFIIRIMKFLKSF